MTDNPFLIPETNYKSTTSIKENFNSDGAIPSEPEENPFLLKETTTETNPFLVQETKQGPKHNWGSTDARDAGVTNHPPQRFDAAREFSPMRPQKNLVDRNAAVPTPGQELSKDLWKRAVGTGVDAVELVNLWPQILSYTEALKRGDNSVSSGHAMEDIRQQTSLREAVPFLQDYPPNPAIQGTMEVIVSGVKKITDKVFGAEPTPAKIAAEDAIILGIFGGGAKALKGRGEPAKPVTGADTIAERLKPVMQDVNTTDARSPYQTAGATVLPPDAVAGRLPPDAVKAKPPDSTKPGGALTKSRVAEINEFNDQAFKNDTGQSIMGSQLDLNINEKSLYQPYWPDPELQQAIQSANRSAQSRVNFKNPYDAPVDIARDGGGMEAVFPDTKVLPVPPTSSDEANVASKMADQRTVDVQTNAKLANELHQAKTLPEAITTVRKYLKDPDQLAVSEVLQKFASKDTGFQALNPDDVATYKPDSAVHKLNDTPTEKGSLGLHITSESGAQNVAVRGVEYFLQKKQRDGLNPETVLHEAAHSVTDKAFFVASHPELAAQPKYANHVRYSADMNDLRLALMKEMSPEDLAHFDAAFENAAEFNAYGWTSPNFREFLSKVELKNYGKNAWERFKDIVKQFLGQDINTVNALKAVDGFMDRLDTIQNADRADVGKAVKRLNAAEAASAMRDKPQTAEELKAKFPIEDVPDLTPFTGKNLLTSNQVKNVVKHPWVDFIWERMNTIKRQEETKQFTRRELYDATIKGTDEKTKVKMYQTLVKINTEPYEVRAQVEAGGMPAIIDYFKSKGLNDVEANKLATMSAILRDVEASDISSASLFDRGWQHQPLYAHLSHAGRFRVLANDAEGKVVMVRGFDKASDAALFYTELKKAGLPDGVTLENVKRSEINSLKAGLAELMLDMILPDYMKKQVQTVEQRMEVARRRFEMERRKDAVHGFVGEDLGDPNTGFGKRQQKALIDAFEARIDASFDFGVKARIAKEILEPLLADPAVQALRPELYNYLNQLVMREMGFPIAKTKAFDAKLQAAADTFFGKPMNKLNNILRGNEPNDVSMLGPRAVENLVQGWTWFTSMAKLGWNINTWAANSTAIPLVALEGWRVAHKEGVSPWYAVMAANDSRQFALGLSQSKDARVFMEQAKREGMVDALISDTYTLDPDARRGLPDKIANAPRDALEYATNFNTIHYFYHFYKRVMNAGQPENLRVDTTSEAFKTKVYEAARSWTGDYSPQATPLALSQLGTTGRAMGNFSKWRFNQLGRLVDDVSTLKDNPGSVHAWGALIALLTTQTLMAGAYGQLGVQDYEAIRRFGQWTGMFELRPFSLYYEDMNKFLGGKIPEWVRRGMLTGLSDFTAKHVFGEDSGPDISGSLRFSSFLEPPTVAFKYFTDVLGGLDWVAKRALMEAGIGKGVTHQSSKEAIDALPTSLKSVVNDWFKTVKIDPNTGEKTYITQQKKLDKGNFEQNEFQRRLDMIGLKTTAENNYNDKVFGAEWTKKYTAKQITERLSAAINWVYEPAGSNPFNKAGVNDPKPDVVKKNLQEVYKLGGITSLREFEKQLMEKPLDRATTYDQRLVGDILRQQDAVRKARMLETLQKFIAEKESRTHTRAKGLK